MRRLPAYPSYPRLTVHAENGMAATSHPAASLAALDMLRAGGTAMDAAVAASAVLGVVEPMSTGIGGDVFCLYAPAGAAVPVAYNGSGRAPAAVDAGRLRGEGLAGIAPGSPHAVTVPGAVEAYCRLIEDHGRLGLDEVLAPAIRSAEEGYVVAPVVGRAWAAGADRLAADPHARELFLPGGHAPVPGDRHGQPNLAGTLRRIAAEGRAGFYENAVAEDMVARLQELGGTHTLDDFAAARGEYVTPVSTELAGCRVYECPPNGQGIVALLMLNILAGFDLASMDPLGVDRLHLTLEAGRLAFRDRGLYVADPGCAEIPVEGLLSGEYAETLRARIDPRRAMAGVPESDPVPKRDTVYISVVDRERNAASFISSLYHGFGSCILAPKSGVMLHCRGVGFSLESGHRNCLAPGKRPMHTIIPGMLARDGHALMPFGVMGADYQPWGHVHFLQNMLLYGMEPQPALDLPRFTHAEGMALLEEGVPEATLRELAERGHRVARPQEPLGGGQAVWIDWERGTLRAGTEPRKDGIALGY